MNKDKEKKSSLEMTDDAMESIAGGDDVRTTTDTYKDLDGNVLAIMRTTETYNNRGKLKSTKVEQIYP